ncbi:MAG TPA: phosphoribosyltransferase family protein [Bacteroidia bacterium]|nr:phosphoribosyltransferase family protein [Bacteroidia bacterium]
MVSVFHDLVNLFFPEVCPACGNALFTGERTICTLCRAFLPRTGFEKVAGNAAENQFTGKVEIAAAASLYYFNKGEKVQQLIHRLKYKGEVEAGREAGRIMGAALKQSGRFGNLQCAVPVPLHKSKLRIRWYNQSLPFAEGVAELLGIAVEPGLLKRKTAASSQTNKGRYARWENVAEAFEAVHADRIAGRHFLLADDVITTGSTLAACAEVMNRSGAASVSVVSIAFASR